jgi:hypothetical protein
MQFQFDSKIAEIFGVNEAVFIQNIFFWINHNAYNKKHCYEGKFWTYNTKEAFVKHFPFWTYSQVKTIIKKLVQNDVLYIGNFNENSWDKTSWYTLNEEVINFLKNDENTSKNALAKISQSNGEISPIEWLKIANRMAKNSQSIIGTDNKPDNKTQIEGALAFFENNFPSSFEAVMMQYKTKIKDFQKFRILFDAKVETEQLEYSERVLRGRFISFATNWIENESKDQKKVIALNAEPVPPYHKITAK